MILLGITSISITSEEARLKKKKTKGVNNMEMLKRFVKEEEGQGLVEYALIAALIAVVCVAALQTLSGDISTKLESVGSSIAAS